MWMTSQKLSCKQEGYRMETGRDGAGVDGDECLFDKRETILLTAA